MGYSSGARNAVDTGGFVTAAQLAQIIGDALGPFSDLGQQVDSLQQSIAALPGTLRFQNMTDVLEPGGVPARGAGAFVPDGSGNVTFLSFSIINDPVAFAAWIGGTSTALAITTATLPGATQGTAYPGATLAAAGGTAPYTWSIVSGWGTGGDSTHPIAGLALNTSTGAISGTPTQAGNLSLVIRATDSAGTPAHVDKTLALTVAATGAPLVFTPGTPAHPQVGVAYTDDTLAAGASGGTTPYTFTATGLANGILLDGDGSVTGHRGRLYTASGSPPTAAVTLTVNVTVTDSAGTPATASATVTITIDPATPLPPHITTTSIPNGVQNAAYPATTLAASAGTPPYTWAMIAWGPGGDATHPVPGMTFNPATGVIAGTPTVSADTTLAFRVTDANAQTDATFLKLQVAAAGQPLAAVAPTVSSATVGQNFDSGSTYANSVSGGVAPYVYQFLSLPNNKIRGDSYGAVTALAGRLYSRTVAWGGVLDPPTGTASGMPLAVTIIDSSKHNVTDAVTAINTNSITSATASFAAGDVGKAVYSPNLPQTVNAYVGVVDSATQIHVVDANGVAVNATASGTAQKLVIGDSVHTSTTMNINPAPSGTDIDISDLIGTTTYLYGSRAGQTVDPAYNVSQINSRATTALASKPVGRLTCARGTPSSPVTIMVANPAAATTFGTLINVNGLNDWSQLGMVIFTLAATQPVNPSGSSSGGTIFYLQNATAPILSFQVDGNAANQQSFLPGYNDNGCAYTGISLFKCGATQWGATVMNCRGTTGSSHPNTAPGLSHITAASNGVNVSTFAGAGVLNVTSTDGTGNNKADAVFSPSKSQVKIGTIIISYTGKTATTFTGCKLVSGSGTLATGQTVNGDPHDGQQECFDTTSRFCAGGDSGIITNLSPDGTGHQNAFVLGSVSVATTTGLSTFANHGLIVGQAFTFSGVGALTGVNTSTTYYVVQRDRTTFKFATSRGGTVVTPGGTTSSVTISAKAGSSVAASGSTWHYMGLGVDGRSTARSSVQIIAHGRRHGCGTYCGGNVTWLDGSEGIGNDTAFNYEAGDPSNSTNPNAQPTGDCTLGRAAGATNGQVYTCRNNIGVNVNGNNGSTGGQVRSLTTYGHDSYYDTDAYNETGTRADVSITPTNARVVSPLAFGIHFASTGAVLAAQQAATFVSASTIHNDQSGAAVMNQQVAFDAQSPSHGQFTAA